MHRDGFVEFLSSVFVGPKAARVFDRSRLLTIAISIFIKEPSPGLVASRLVMPRFRAEALKKIYPTSCMCCWFDIASSANRIPWSSTPTFISGV